MTWVSKLKSLGRDSLMRLLALLVPAKWLADNRYFSLWEKKGIHVTPIGDYEPIPDTRTLKEMLWKKRSNLTGVRMNEEGQIKLLDKFVREFKAEYDQLPLYENELSKPYEYFIHNCKFEGVDGEILYSFIRHLKPKKIYEVGSGHSTRLSAQASLKNRALGHGETELIAFEPYPVDFLKKDFPGLTKLVPTLIQDVPVSEFEKLRENDILFIDSSHVVNIGGDVTYEILEIFPRLSKGVVIHVHDIFIPSEYPKEWVLKNHWFFAEQYLFQAFLSFNDSFEVLWAASYMHLNHPDRLERAFRSYRRDRWWPGSFWIRKIN